MSSLFNAMNQTARTANGALTHHSSLNPCVDFFFAAGSSRGKNIDSTFMQAFRSNPEIALRTLLWMRDIRGGAGEREQFKRLIKVLINNGAFEERLFPLIPIVGRWDDLEIFFGTQFEAAACKLWTDAIVAGNGLAAKWAPRKDKKGAKPLRKFIGLNEHEWRKLVVSKTDVVETKMCKREWDNINYSHVPSQAMTKYMTAFYRNSPEFIKWKEALSAGDPSVKVNAGAVYPYDILRSLPNGSRAGGWSGMTTKVNDPVMQTMWESLPDYLQGNDERMLPIIDVSGSMMDKIPNQQATCMDVAIALGIYISERNTGIFKDYCMSFSDHPRMYRLNGTLADKHNQVISSENIGYSTVLKAVFSTLLNQAKKFNVPAEEMPTKLFVVSDMEFNSAFHDGRSITNYDAARKEYAKYGYELPQIVFWRVNTKVNSNVPVTVNEHGTALVSGFSPAILTSLLGNNLTPEKVMMDAVMKDRYQF